MKRNKIILISIIVVVIFIVAILAFGAVYYTTDLLKTNKQLFFKYSGQMLMTEAENNKIANYFNMKTQKAYENSGKISVNNFASDSTYQELVEQGNKVNITFEGKTDGAN